MLTGKISNVETFYVNNLKNMVNKMLSATKNVNNKLCP